MVVHRVFQIGLKRRVNSFLEGFQTVRNRDNGGAQYLHPDYIGVLLDDVHFPHVDLTFQSKIGCSRGQGHAMLAAPVSAISFFFPINLASRASPMHGSACVPRSGSGPHV
jgi:hypothetical protein